MSDRLDEAIDRAVREMLDVEPRADLRDRVASAFRRNHRIPVASAFRRNIRMPVASAFRRNIRMPVASAFRRNRALVFAAAAAILIAMFVARRTVPVALQAPVIAHGADVRLPSVIPPNPAELPMRAAPARARVTVAASVAADADVTLGGVEPLDRIAPIAIAPITQDSIAPGRMAIAPLNPIDELQIAPLTPPDRRN